MRGSSVQAIKAETAAEIAASQKEVQVIEIAPQSLRKLMGGDTTDNWQAISTALFNSGGEYQYWKQGMNGAVAVAYSAARQLAA